MRPGGSRLSPGIFAARHASRATPSNSIGTFSPRSATARAISDEACEELLTTLRTEKNAQAGRFPKTLSIIKAVFSSLLCDAVEDEISGQPGYNNWESKKETRYQLTHR